MKYFLKRHFLSIGVFIGTILFFLNKTQSGVGFFFAIGPAFVVFILELIVRGFVIMFKKEFKKDEWIM